MYLVSLTGLAELILCTKYYTGYGKEKMDRSPFFKVNIMFI